MLSMMPIFCYNLIFTTTSHRNTIRSCPVRLLSILTAAASTMHVSCLTSWRTLLLSMQVSQLPRCSRILPAHSIFSCRRFRAKHQLESQLVDADHFS
jgi:hypothetical protein